MTSALKHAFLLPAFIIAKMLTFAPIPIGNIARAVEFCSILVSCAGRSRQQLRNHLRPLDARQALIETLEAETEAFVVDAQTIEDRGVQIEQMARPLVDV